MAAHKFEITQLQGYFDGVSLHKRGTIVEIDEKDFPVLLRGTGMAPLDETGRRAVQKLNGGKDVARLIADNTDAASLEEQIASLPRARPVAG